MGDEVKRRRSAFFGALFSILIVAFAARPVLAETKDLGNGFLDHGVATPASNHRGTVATVDGNGRNVALVWLNDYRGGYALLMIDAETGKSAEFPTPFPIGNDSSVNTPYASLLSSRGKFYTLFGSHFVEFDPVKRAFTFRHETAPHMAMGMTEDDDGVIWSATYPRCGLVSFDPKTRAFKDYGHVDKQDWLQYPRWVAADDAGWVYIGVGFTASQILAFNPRTGIAKPMLPENERDHDAAHVYRDLNGKVYGCPLDSRRENWHEFHRGEAKKIGALERPRRKPIVTSYFLLFHRDFPDGKTLKECDLVERTLSIEDPKTGRTTSVRFDYTTEGATIMGVAVAPDGTLCGGTTFPMRFFSYSPKTDRWINREAYGQFNTLARQGEKIYFGGYTGGFLLEWDPAGEWASTVKEKPGGNPRFLTDCPPAINRPHKLLAHPDGGTLVLAGTPAYGHTGGGLLIWNRATRSRTLLEHTDILPCHSTMSLVALPNGKLLGGTTIEPGAGGEKKVAEAEMYIMDLATKKIDWHGAVIPGAQEYTDLCNGPDGRVFGIADKRRFFVFDPVRRDLVRNEDCASTFGPAAALQGPRVFVTDPDARVYILFLNRIAVVDPKTFALKTVAESPIPIDSGGDILDGRLYFSGRSRLYSFKPPD